MTDQEKQAVYDCVREMLWVAKVWNDHNFSPDVIREKAKRLSARLDIKNVDEANEFLNQLQKQLEK